MLCNQVKNVIEYEKRGFAVCMASPRFLGGLYAQEFSADSAEKKIPPVAVSHFVGAGTTE